MGVVFVTGWTLFLFEGSFMPETVARGMDLLKVLSIGDKSLDYTHHRPILACCD
jgi:hypothetical protein